MSINWKVRLRHRQFWLGLTGALGTFAMAMAGLAGHSEHAEPIIESVQGVLVSALAILCLLGVVVDPTTEGAEDSDQAMLYEEPKPKNKL